MCRFVIRAEPKLASTDEDINQNQRIVGDMIECLPDGMHPGTEVMSDPRWRIVDVPGMTVEEGQAYCAPEAKDIDETLAVRKNACSADLSKIETDNPKARQEIITVTPAYFRNRVTVKPRVQKPREVGKSPRVL